VLRSGMGVCPEIRIHFIHQWCRTAAWGFKKSGLRRSAW